MSSLREAMPETAAFIDNLRVAFGAASVDPAIKAGMRGEANRFHAAEAGQTFGTAFERGFVVRPRTIPKDPTPAKRKKR